MDNYNFKLIESSDEEPDDLDLGQYERYGGYQCAQVAKQKKLMFVIIDHQNNGKYLTVEHTGQPTDFATDIIKFVHSLKPPKRYS